MASPRPYPDHLSKFVLPALQHVALNRTTCHPGITLATHEHLLNGLRGIWQSECVQILEAEPLQDENALVWFCAVGTIYIYCKWLFPRDRAEDLLLLVIRTDEVNIGPEYLTYRPWPFIAPPSELKGKLAERFKATIIPCYVWELPKPVSWGNISSFSTYRTPITDRSQVLLAQYRIFPRSPYQQQPQASSLSSRRRSRMSRSKSRS